MRGGRSAGESVSDYGSPFRRRGLRFVLSVSFSLAAIIGMLILGVLITVRSEATTRNILAQDNELLLSQINVNLDRALRDAMRISESVYYHVIKNNDIDTAKIREDIALISDSNRGTLENISIFSETGALLASAPEQELKKGAAVADQPWFKGALATIENVHFSAPHVQQIFENFDGQHPWVVSISRSVQLSKQGAVSRGVLLIDLRYATIEQLLNSFDFSDSAYIYLIDSAGDIIFHPRQQLIYSDLATENNLIHLGYSDGVHTEDYAGAERMVTVKTVAYTGWKIVAVKPLSELNDDRYALRLYSSFLLFSAIFFLLLINHVLSFYLTRPIKRLETQVLKLESGEALSFSADPGLSPEIFHLGRAIEALVLQQEQLRRDILREQEAKRRNELEALQAQINPHFLYNTLDSIIWMIESERYAGAVEMVSALARFFRLSLARGRSIISVSEELEQIKSYLAIQKVRYRNQFSYTIEAEDEVLGRPTIKLIVQPLVENAILHGMGSLDEEGEIHIRAYRSGDFLFIDVADNGLGMNEEQRRRLLSGGAAPNLPVTSGGSGIGVANVNKRIKLFFGAAYGLEIFSEPDEGTTVRIRLPWRKEEADGAGEGGEGDAHRE